MCSAGNARGVVSALFGRKMGTFPAAGYFLRRSFAIAVVHLKVLLSERPITLGF